MIENNDFAVIESPGFGWPSSIQLPSKRFRLLVAADVTKVDTDEISNFPSAALNCGMMYLCLGARLREVSPGQLRTK